MRLPNALPRGDEQFPQIQEVHAEQIEGGWLFTPETDCPIAEGDGVIVLCRLAFLDMARRSQTIFRSTPGRRMPHGGPRSLWIAVDDNKDPWKRSIAQYTCM